MVDLSDIMNPTRMRLNTMSDSELTQLSMDNARKINAIPRNASSAQLTEAEWLLKEMEFCKEIVESRKNAKEKWKAALPDRVEAAILNLETAVSPNGQLVAAILEDEDGKTAAEINAWCEELAAMEEQDIVALLDALVKEGVLEQREGKYYLLRVCTETLFPEYPTEWALRVLRHKAVHYGATEEIILRSLEGSDGPLLAADFPDAVKKSSNYYWMKRNLDCDGEDFDTLVGAIESGKAEYYLQDLMYDGVLQETWEHGERLYYWPMLGEVKNK